jgi:tetratricopeptide (TPR) repeat protein
MGNHSYAIQDFRKAIEIDPKYENAYFFSGSSKIKLKLIQEAIEDFSQSLYLNDNMPGVYDGLG